MAPPILTTEVGEGSENGGIGVDAVETDDDSSPRAGNHGGFSIGSDSLGFRVCVRCDVRDALILNCCETGCLISVHESCLRCNPSFDDSGRFVCPVCKQRRAAEQVEKARKKVMVAKRALSIFLQCGDKGDRIVGGAAMEEAQDEASRIAATENRTEEAEKQVERDGQLEIETLVYRPKRFKQTAGKTKIAGPISSPRVKMPFTRYKGIARKNASGPSVHDKTSSPGKFKPPATLHTIDHFSSRKRQRLKWTLQEVKLLRESVKQQTETNKKNSWKSILEKGRHVFHSTRHPTDLQYKWKTMRAKGGSGGYMNL